MTRAELLQRYREGPDELEAAVAGMTEAQLDRRPGPGEWTPREVVNHCADSETMACIRLRKLLAEEGPLIQGYDQAEWARRLHYSRRPIAPALAAVRAARATSLSILELLDEPDWKRAGTHSESGPYSVEKWLEIYAAHCHDHAQQIRRAGA